MLQTWKSRSECTVLAFILKHFLPLCLSEWFLAVTRGIPQASRAFSSLHIWEKPLQQFGNCKTVSYKNIKLATLIAIRDATERRAMDLLCDNHSHICWCQPGLKGVSRVTRHVSDFVNYFCDYGTCCFVLFCFLSCSIKGEVEKRVKIQESHSKKGKAKVLALINPGLCSSRPWEHSGWKHVLAFPGYLKAKFWILCIIE